jgi:hypothetical protein
MSFTPSPSLSVLNPLDRTPLALIVDDSCPVVNLTYYWIRQRHAWKAKHQPGVAPDRWEGEQRQTVPPTIPADFAARWADWCGAEGIRGKFSLVPYPAGVFRVDQGYPDAPPGEWDAWMRVYRERIVPHFDITCELLTHTHVVDVNDPSLPFTEAWEQVEWTDPPTDGRLTPYIATALTLLKEAGFAEAWVTSPGAFGGRNEPIYAKAIQDAARAVYGDSRPFYFLRVHVPPKEWPEVALWHTDAAAGTAIASVAGCTDDRFGSWTGYDAGNADYFLTPDLTGGVLRPVLDRELPCVLVSHWPGFYFGGEEVGFQVLKEVKRRLDAFDPDGTRTRWMKTSAIGRYEMARRLSEIQAAETDSGTLAVTIRTRFPTPDFTLSAAIRARRVQVNGMDLNAVSSRRAFRAGTFLTEAGQTLCAFDLPPGETRLTLTAA